MAACYVVLSHTNYASAFNVPSPVAVFDTKKEANEFARVKNEKSSRLTYYVRSASRGKP